MTQVIPLQGGSVNAHQVVSVQLGDNLYDLTLNYQQTGAWALNIDREGVRLVSGATLEPNADVIKPWRLGIGQLFFIGDLTTLENLGSNNQLVWVAPDE